MSYLVIGTWDEHDERGAGLLAGEAQTFGKERVSQAHLVFAVGGSAVLVLDCPP